MRNAECRWRGRAATELSRQFRIPHSAFRILMAHTTFRVGRLTCHALAELGHAPPDVRWVIDTHLHFDHAGGNTYRDPSGRVTLSFPKARYVVQRGELEFARHTNERTAASYLPPNFESVPFTLIDGEAQPLPGIRCLPTPGHVPYRSEEHTSELQSPCNLVCR